MSVSQFFTNEQNILQFWKDRNIREKTVRFSNKPIFRFLDGPPFVSGTLHMGHLYVGALKDAVVRYQTMNGFDVTNKMGFDCHGLPIESLIAKELGITNVGDYCIKKFNDACKQKIQELSGSWEPIYKSIGRWTNFTNVYKTMDRNYMESVWWIFDQLNKKGLIYKGYKVMPVSTKYQTPLSNFEADNYKDIDTNTVYVCFDLVDKEDTCIVAWTTTPWTLPSNIALCVNPEMEYVVCTDKDNKKFIVAKDSVKNLSKDFVSFDYDTYKTGKDLEGLQYKPLFNYLEFKYHKVVCDTYVKKSDSGTGTGIVHIAPAFGADDCRICEDKNIIKSKDLDQVCPVDMSGCFKNIITDYAGQYVLNCDKQIIKDLKSRNKVVRVQQHKHSYPHCPRSDLPLLYMNVECYFIAVTKIKDRMVELNKTINWTTPDIGSGRFHNWLENAKDWCVSRNRYFGTPLPVFVSEDGEEMITVGSIKELCELANLEDIPDIHKEFFDEITFKSPKSGKLMRSTKLVADCWLESGAAPYAQLHYPFENADAFDNREYLSDFIAEGLDQTRGWFYTLLVISTAISDKAPFENVICTGLILDSKGDKFSKRNNNYVDVNMLFEKYGADVLRLYVLQSQLINAEPLKFSEEHVAELCKDLIGFENCVNFLEQNIITLKNKTNLSIEYIKDSSICSLQTPDMWILEKVSQLCDSVKCNMSKYKVDKSVRDILSFIEDLRNWYLKISRERMKDTQLYENEYFKCDAQKTLSVLYTIIHDFVIASCPFMPFLTERIYQKLGLYVVNECESVHMEKYPNLSRNLNMTESFDCLKNFTILVRTIRDTSKTHTSVKKPIKKCIVSHSNEQYLNNIKGLVKYVQDELNCLDFSFLKLETNDVSYSVVPNKKTLGKKCKSNLKYVIDYIEKLDSEFVRVFEESKQEFIEVKKGEEIVATLQKEDYEIVRKPLVDKIVATQKDFNKTHLKVTEDNGLIVFADLEYDEKVHDIFESKKFVSLIQNIRKINGLMAWNKINVEYEPELEKFQKFITENKEYIVGKLGCEILNKQIDDACLTEVSSRNDMKVYGMTDQTLYTYKNKDNKFVHVVNSYIFQEYNGTEHDIKIYVVCL